MLFPNKHIKVAESLIGLGSFILESLVIPKTIDELWNEFQEINNSKQFPAYHSFENMILSLDFLYSIEAITDNENGKLIRCF
jgi:hypothetical protein